MDRAGVEEGALRQHQFVGDILKGAALHRRPVLIEAGGGRGLIEQGDLAAEPLREAGHQGGIVAAQAERRGVRTLQRAMHLHRRQRFAGARLGQVAGAVGEQLGPAARVLGTGDAPGLRIPEGIAAIAQHRFHRITPQRLHMAHQLRHHPTAPGAGIARALSIAGRATRVAIATDGASVQSSRTSTGTRLKAGVPLSGSLRGRISTFASG